MGFLEDQSQAIKDCQLIMFFILDLWFFWEQGDWIKFVLLVKKLDSMRAKRFHEKLMSLLNNAVCAESLTKLLNKDGEKGDS